MDKQREKEILRLAYQGGAELTDAFAKGGKKAEAEFLRRIRRETSEFLQTCQDREELHVFATNWRWGGGVKPIFELLKNPHVDAGTLLEMFWNAAPEDYYSEYRTLSEVDGEFERDVYRALRQIERRFV